MSVDWGLALQVSGIGFAAIFIVVIVLAVVIWLGGLAFSKINTTASKTGNKKKGD